MISSLAGDLRTFARVVYCQRLPDGRFGLGLQLRSAIGFTGLSTSCGPSDSEVSRKRDEFPFAAIFCLPSCANSVLGRIVSKNASPVESSETCKSVYGEHLTYF
jgi:hypothetical protein